MGVVDLDPVMAGLNLPGECTREVPSGPSDDEPTVGALENKSIIPVRSLLLFTSVFIPFL